MKIFRLLAGEVVLPASDFQTLTNMEAAEGEFIE
jgi:hypothetical protein